MREIKFRAWDKREKRMVIVLAINFNTNFLHYAFDNSWGVKYGKSYWSDIYNFELMQYTGFKDKYGKEIWEGDILEGRNNPKPVYYVAKWIDRLASFRLVTPEGYEINLAYPTGLEVIGNIYENPELLGDEK